MTFLPTEVTIGNQALYIEIVDVGPAHAEGPTPAGLDAPAMLGRLEAAGEAAGEACKAVFKKLDVVLTDRRPDEFTVEFGITLGGETGIPFVAKGTAEAAFKVSATWKTSTHAAQPAGATHV